MLRFMIVTIAIALMFQPCLMGEEEIVIAVASDGKTADDSVSSLAARCPYFLFFDSTGKLLEAVENPHKDKSRGAGISAVHFLAERNVTIVVAGNFGSKMINALEEREMAHFKFEGIVEDAVSEIMENKDRT